MNLGRPSRPALDPRAIAEGVLWTVAYVVFALPLLALAPASGGETAMIWPSAAIAVFAVLRLGPPMFPAILLAAGSVGWIAGDGWPEATARALGAVLEAAVAWTMLRHQRVSRGSLSVSALAARMPAVSILVPAAGALVTWSALSAVAGADLLEAARIAARGWIADAVAIASFLPLLVVWRVPPRLLPDIRAMVLAGVHLAVVVGVFTAAPGDLGGMVPTAYLVFPGALLIAVNAGAHLTTFSNAVVAIGGTWALARGSGPFAGMDPAAGHLAFDVFLATITGTAFYVHGLASAQRQATAQLKAGFDRFRSLAGLSADWQWETDTQMRFTRVSGRAFEAGELNAGQFIGKRRVDLEGEVSSEDGRRHDAAIARREAFRDVAIAWHGTEGTTLHHALSGEPVTDASGAFTGYRGVGRDVSLLKQAEEEIAHSRQFLNALIDAIPSPVLVKDARHRYVGANPSFIEFFGRPREQVIGRTDHDFFEAEDADYFVATDNEALQSDTPVDYERSYRVNDAVRWMLVRKTALTAPDGNRFVLLVLFDLTDRRAAEERLRDSEQRFRSLTELSADWYWEQDEQYRFTYLSPTALAHVASSMSELLGKTRFDAGYEWPSERAREEHRALLEARKPFRDLVLRIPRLGRWAMSSGEPVFDAGGNFRGYRGVGRDITELKTVELQLRESERRFRDFAEAASEFVWEQDSTGAYVYVSPKVRSLLGYSDTELIGRRPEELMPAGEQQRVEDWLREHAREDGSYRDLEHMLTTRTGAMVWVGVNAVTIRDAEGRVMGYRGTARDITDRKAAEERISQLATRDALTGLPNRLLLQDRLEQGLVNARRNREALALMFIDLDRFKTINDSLGHDVGDLLLKEVAARMQGCIRKGDTVARLGGDEFVITLEGLQQAEDAAQVADKITAALARPVQVLNHTLNTSCSIGISIFPDDADDSASLMKNADTAMYHAKEKGRRNYQFFSREMNIRAVERHDLETALRRALDRNEFVLHYQPQVDIASGHVAGVEVLLRWRHPTKGLVQPSTFMEVAEETGLIDPIGAWVLRSACEQAKAWQDAGYPPLRIAVNVSARQFTNPNEFARNVQRILGHSGLDPTHLELEMTESVLWQTAEDSLQAFRRLGKLGTRLAVDDFGTGYSSLINLKQLPIDTLKIDRSFVRDVESDKGSNVLVSTIVGMAHSLDLRVTAEGVENLAQLSVLKRLGCDEYQGFLFNRPLPADEIARRYLAPRQLNFGA